MNMDDDMGDDIDDWRNEIDEIDEKLVELLNRRSRCAIEVGRLKRERGLAIYSPEREAEVLSLVVEHNGGPLEPDAIRRLFERIIDEARRIERLAIEREADTATLNQNRTRRPKKEGTRD